MTSPDPAPLAGCSGWVSVWAPNRSTSVAVAVAVAGVVGVGDADRDAEGGPLDQDGQVGRGYRRDWRHGRFAWYRWRIQADDGVEMGDGASLEFGDLHVVEAHTFGGFTDGAQVAVQQAAQGDGEAPPQFGGVPGEQDMPGVVVAVFAQRLTHVRIMVVVDGAAPQRFPVLTAAIAACGPGRDSGERGLPCLSSPLVWTAPKLGAVRVTNTWGCSATVVGMSWCPPCRPACISCQVSRAYRSEHDGHATARRLLQRVHT